MSLTSCRGCGCELPSPEGKCPNCGRPVKAFLATGEVICPNPDCDYAGPPERRGASSFAGCFGLAIVSMPAFLIPSYGAVLGTVLLICALLYFLCSPGPRYHCPKCGLEIERD